MSEQNKTVEEIAERVMAAIDRGANIQWEDDDDEVRWVEDGVGDIIAAITEARASKPSASVKEIAGRVAGELNIAFEIATQDGTWPHREALRQKLTAAIEEGRAPLERECRDWERQAGIYDDEAQRYVAANTEKEAENARLREALGFVRARILEAHGCYPLPYAGESSSTQQLSRAMIRIDATLKGDEG